jgi:hypothetical protein
MRINWFSGAADAMYLQWTEVNCWLDVGQYGVLYTITVCTLYIGPYRVLYMITVSTLYVGPCTVLYIITMYIVCWSI